MRYICKRTSVSLITASLLGLSSTAFAVNPVEGWYAGIYLGPSYAPTTVIPINKTYILPSSSGQIIPVGTASLSYGVLGGVGGEAGYRCGHLRAEGQLLYNNNPYSSLSTNEPKMMINGTRTTYNGVALPPSMKGQTNIGAALINGFFDLYTPGKDNVSNIAPYIGLGVGYAYVQNNITFQFPNALASGAINASGGQFWHSYAAVAGQAIAGVNYFMDDFTTMGIDLRFFSTANENHPARYTFTSFNTKAQIYSANLIFNGAFDLG